jgi:hypothetical protein
VLSMIKQHNTTDCPCIPKNIENLLVGSTHFEIHRIVAKKLDSSVEAKQYESFKQKAQKENSKNQHETILNDCLDCSRRDSRFKAYSEYFCSSHVDSSKIQLKHLCQAIDFWRLAMEDQMHPFNSKLALRLGLTHHVIYACYLFKYYKILDYQLITANLLLNVFRSIEGVTANAILHAYFLVVKSLIDCDQLQLARHYLRQAMRLSNYQDKSNYESILVNCVACELSFIDGHRESYNILDELSDLVSVKEDDKLQHYYARTLAMSTIVRYIHHYPPKTDHCFEFFHTFRYICAMMRRCYENSFDLILAEKNPARGLQGKERSSTGTKQTQILDHSWIRFAICDFVFHSFDLLTEFFVRAGLPECLELIYNGLNLISYRNGSVYWQSRVLAIGARLDLLCDKYKDAHVKLDILSRIAEHTDDANLMVIIKLNLDLGLLAMRNQQSHEISKIMVEEILERIRICKASILDRIQRIELYDVKSNSFTKTTAACNVGLPSGSIVMTGHLAKLSLIALDLGVASCLRTDRTDNLDAMEFVTKLKNQIELMSDQELDFYMCQMILEMLVRFTNIDNSEHLLLECLNSSNLFIDINDDKLFDIQSQLSSLTLQSGDANRNGNRCDGPKLATNKKGSKIPTSRRSKRKGTYEVAILSEKNFDKKTPPTRVLSVLETVSNFETLTKEEIVVTYLRNSEPNPDYNLYRRAHELMLTFRLADVEYNYESILYHISESATANSMRYRWMMLEEQSVSPFDQQVHQHANSNSANLTLNSSIKNLGFCNMLTNQDSVIKAMTRTIPDDSRLIQLKYILDKRVDLEHLLCICIGNHSGEQVYVHAQRPLSTGDFYNDATILLNGDDTSQLTIPNRLATKIDESRRSLLMKSNQRTLRAETRQQIEADIGIILNDIENEWFGSFRFLFCGKIYDPSYNNLIQCLMSDMQAVMGSERACRSNLVLRMVLENAPLLSREEFCQVIATLFNCDSGSREPRECFNKWLRCIESHMAEQNLGMNKTSYLKQLPRGQVGLILDNELEMIPFESLPVVRVVSQGLFRVPSLRLYSIMAARRCSPIKIDCSETAYMLDPANNLERTRERFDNKLKGQSDWCGTIGHPPKTEDLEKWLTSKSLYIFIGHGAGTAYYNKLCKGRGPGALTHMECVAIVMGCSSGRMLAEGPRLETFGIGWLFLFKGSPCYVGLLWDVTDCDIDRFLDALLDRWLPARRQWASSASSDKHHQQQPLTDCSARARNVCQLKLLVGSAPVVYGLPIWCKD